MVNQFERQIRLIGEQGHEKLKSSRVIVFGVGGVGSYAVEALARSGIGHLALVDADKVCHTMKSHGPAFKNQKHGLKAHAPMRPMAPAPNRQPGVRR